MKFKTEQVKGSGYWVVSHIGKPQPTNVFMRLHWLDKEKAIKYCNQLNERVKTK